MLTYENATELLHLNLEEEGELRILSEAALLRFQWRCDQVFFEAIVNFFLLIILLSIVILFVVNFISSLYHCHDVPMI